ncbi:MAG: ornithine cyclodeaminase family protein [Dehalococcoidia bacterium]|nr:ornithine cyclodeaminase family protein [Dehalococcoidia bacterium]
MARILTDAEIKSMVNIGDMMDAVEEMHRRYAVGEAFNADRRTVELGDGHLAIMGGGLAYEGLYGAKTYTTVAGTQQYHVTLYDAATGRLKSFIHANWLGALRTGATTGVAVRHLANADADVLGMIGTGYQAQTQVMAVAQARPLKQVKVYSRRTAPRVEFADRLSQVLDVEVLPVQDARDAVQGSSIVVCLTTTKEPVMDGVWLEEGALLVSAGPVTLDAQEVDAVSLQRAGLIVTDSLEQARYEAGELVAGVEAGIIRWDDVVQLSHVVAGLTRGRRERSENIYVKHFGIGVVDIAAAKLAFDLALAKGVGLEIDI